MDFSTLARAVIGGGLIGIAASVLLVFNGRIAGISNIAAGLLSPPDGDTSWRLSFVVGLLAGGMVVLFTVPTAFPAAPPRSIGLMAIAGVLVGVGTRIGNGCSSGHGICGIARRSRRSLAATITFMVTGALTVYVARHLLGWSIG